MRIAAIGIVYARMENAPPKKCRRRQRLSRSASTVRWLADEPFRVLFPLGVLLGAAGVMLWPLFYWGKLGYYPLLPHARLMVEGFLAAFAFGFLGTAMPKVLEAPRFSPAEVAAWVLLLAGAAAAHLGHRIVVGDALFAAAALVFCAGLGIRWLKRTGSPPPGFVLASLGPPCGLAGAMLAAWGAAIPFWGAFGLRLLHFGFLLLPLLGVGSFLFPRMLGTLRRGDGGAKPARGFALAGALAAGGAAVAGLALEAAGFPRTGGGIVAAAAAIWFTAQTGWLRRSGAKGAFPVAVRCGIACLILGPALTPFFPAQRIAMEHITLAGGFGLLAFAAGARAVYGHSGQSEKFAHCPKSWWWLLGLALLAVSTRVSADFLPASRIAHHVYAALTWLAASVLYAVAVLPYVAMRDPEVEGDTAE
ncbi:MAG: NnrS family protein [Verrucomicrobiales bacterium]